MNTRKMLTIGVVALVLVGVALFLGFRQLQRKERLAAFQTFTREGSAKAEATLGMISADSISLSQIKPECERFVEENRGLIEKVTALDTSDAPELQNQYVTLLTAEDDLMMSIGNEGDFERRQAKEDLLNPNETNKESCSWARGLQDVKAEVRDKAQKVLALEQQFQSTCVAHALSCEPTFAKHGQYLAEDFKARDLPDYCN